MPRRAVKHGPWLSRTAVISFFLQSCPALCSPGSNTVKREKRRNVSWRKMRARKNNIFIISAPSGAGKSTLIQLLLAQMPWLFFSVSHTTRPPRQGEKDGVEYFFVSEEKFQEM